jgi:hypothetical protein
MVEWQRRTSGRRYRVALGRASNWRHDRPGRRGRERSGGGDLRGRRRGGGGRRRTSQRTRSAIDYRRPGRGERGRASHGVSDELAEARTCGGVPSEKAIWCLSTSRGVQVASIFCEHVPDPIPQLVTFLSGSAPGRPPLRSISNLSPRRSAPWHVTDLVPFPMARRLSAPQPHHHVSPTRMPRCPASRSPST